MFNSLEKFKKNIAFEDDKGKSLSYLDILSFADHFNKLIPPRSLVFCLCSNNEESVIGYVSFIKNKIVPLLLDSSLDEDSVKKLCSKYNPDYLWMPSSRIEKFINTKVLFSYKEYSLISYINSKGNQLHSELALLLTTSGSTGSPKLVRISYKNLKSNAESISKYLSIDKNQRPITSLPMSYSFGLSIINSHLINGARILLTSRSLMEKDFWNFLKNKKATSISGVPYSFEILKRLRFFNMDLPSLKVLTQAGGRLHKDLVKDFATYCNDNKKSFYVMYGQTEATARMSYVPQNFLLEKLDSIGIAIPGGSFSIIDENGQDIHKNEKTGELKYTGPNVSLGYANSRSDLYKGDENEGNLLTGDLAKRDEDGFYYIVGRKKRFIKVFGNRINLDEMEQLVKEVTEDVACSGTDDNMLIYLKNKNMTEVVKKYITKRTGIHFKAFKLIIIEEIPKNLSGKILYTKLPKE